MLTLTSVWRCARLTEHEFSACLVAKRTSEILRFRNENIVREVILLSGFDFGVTFWKNAMPNFNSHNFQ